MTATEFTPISAAIGGALIGISALLLLVLNGKVCGISGISYKALNWHRNKHIWPILFLLGMLAGTAFYNNLITADSYAINSSWSAIIISAVLVGAGSRLGAGCTSGHGICGIGRFSIRSITATCCFLITAIITAQLTPLL